MTVKQVLTATHCFIAMNIMETTCPELEYIHRLGTVVSMMNGDEEVYDQFTKMFDDEKVCQTMIKWLDAFD